MAPKIVTEIFPLRPQDQYNLRSWSDFTLQIVRTVNYGTESIRYLGPKIWGKYSSKYKRCRCNRAF